MSSSKRGAWQTGISAVLILMLVSPIAWTADVPSSPPARPATEAKLRCPVAIALADDGKMLLVANRRTGSVSLVEPNSARLVAEVPVGKSLSDLVALQGASAGLFLASDWAGHQLHLLSYRDRSLKVVDSLAVAPFPATICADAAGRKSFVASQWSRQLTVVDVEHKSEGSPKLKLKQTIPLTFPPREQALSPDGKRLVVADAFGGRLAVVDVPRLKLQLVQVIPGHNIRGLAWSGDGRRLLVVHQTLNRLAYSTAEDIHWGSVVSNVVRALDRDALLSAIDVLEHSQLYQLGDVGNGAGDPSSLAIAKDGTAYLALSGVGEVAGGRLERGEMHRVHAGTRPTALALSVDGTELYAIDTFGDAIDVLKTKDLLAGSDKSIRRISLGPQPALSAADRGERLFFDAHLSNENWMSCHSCHSDGHSPDQLSDTLGDSSFGAPKRIPALGGVAQTGPWAWNGSMHDLGEQVQKSVKTTMRAKAIAPEQVRDLTEYLKTLEPAPPIGGPSDSSQQAVVERGRQAFKHRGCDRCHVPPTYTSPKTYDVGLKDEMGSHLFNPPSLRGVGQRTALFHDGRAASLAEVLQVHRHPNNREIPTEEVADLIAFLRTL